MAYVSKEFRPVESSASIAEDTAAEETEVKETEVDEAEDDKGEYWLSFKKPYKFEGTEYDGIDMEGIVELTTADMLWAERHCSTETMINPVKEMSTEVAMLLASRATGKPIEFFKFLPIPDMTHIRLAIMGFTYGTD